MREEVKIVKLNDSEQNMALKALVDYRNKQIAEGKNADFVGEVIQDIVNAPTKHRKIKERDNAR